MNVVITGANRGIGLAFVKSYLQAGWAVFAGYRESLGGLADIKNDQLHCIKIDITENLGADVELLNQFPQKINLLINNAGIYGPKKSLGQCLEDVTPETMREVFEVDCIGVINVVQGLLSRIKQAKGVIANMSSKMGSITDNSSGGCYAYRSAKAALLMVSKSMAVDLASDDVRVIALHPGWVKTDMTNHSGLIDVETSVAGLVKVIKNIDHYEPGSFIAFDGKIIPF